MDKDTEMMWHDELGLVEIDNTPDLRTVGLYRIAKVYVQVVHSPSKNRWISAWSEESKFDESYGMMGLDRSDFEEISGETLFNAFPQELLDLTKRLDI